MNIRANVTPINNDTALKGLATVYVNNSIAIGSVRIMESEEKGLFVKMPSKKNFRSGEYEDIVFPITKEAREQINNAVIEAYTIKGKVDSMSEDEKTDFISDYDVVTEMGKTATEQEKALYKALTAAEETETPKTYIKVSLRATKDDSEGVKAYGQVTLDDSVVITGIKVIEGKNGLFVGMPNYQREDGEYKDIAFPITSDMHEKLKNAVLAKYQSLNAERLGVKFSELKNSDDDTITNHQSLNNKFAKRVIAELDKAGVKYSAKIDGTTSIAVNTADEPRYKEASDAVKKSISEEKDKEKNNEPVPPKHKAR